MWSIRADRPTAARATVITTRPAFCLAPARDGATAPSVRGREAPRTKASKSGTPRRMARPRGAPPAERARGGELLRPSQLATRLGGVPLFSVIATLGAPIEITSADLAIETFLPADPESAQLLRRLAKERPRSSTLPTVPSTC